MSADYIKSLRWKLLKTFGVPPWSEEAEKLTDEMCLEYADMLDMEEERSGAFDEAAFFSAKQREFAPRQTANTEAPAVSGSHVPEMSDFIEREMRRRDTGFIIY